MSTDVRFEDDTLTLTRTYDAPREEVFDAWVAVSKVEQWWGCNQTVGVKSEIEPRVGGKYFHRMTHEVAGEFSVDCYFTEFSPPAKLAYAAGAPDAADPPSAANYTVTVEFIDRGGKTEVRLTHTGLVDPMAREHVPHGWTAAFEKLDRFLVAAA